MKKSKIGIYTAIGAVIVIVIFISIFLLTSQTSNVHFGFVQDSVLEKYTNTTLRESSVITLNGNSSKIIKSEGVYYNGSHGQIFITISEYKNTSLAENAFYQFVHSPRLPWESCGPVEQYHGFSYVVCEIQIPGGSFHGVAIGYSSNFVFQINDMNIPVSNMDPIVQAQIDAMV